VRFEDLHSLLERLEKDAILFAPAQVRSRIEVIDKLDAHFGGLPEEEPGIPDRLLRERTTAILSRLESANAQIYRTIREDIRHGDADSLRNCIAECRKADDASPGLGSDCLDELIAGVLQIREPRDEGVHLGPEQVFYQPTPVRHALAVIERSQLSANDVLVDFGSGLGQFCMLASILAGAETIGVEVEAAFIESARECAESLRLDRVRFVHCDARMADLSHGTVFHLYTPFTGSILRSVLNRLQQESTNRRIRVCTLGPCSEAVAQEPWLRPDARPDADRVTIFRSGK